MSAAKNRAGAVMPSRPGTAVPRPGIAASETSAKSEDKSEDKTEGKTEDKTEDKAEDKTEDKSGADPEGPDVAPYIVTPTGDRVPLAQYLAEGK